MCARVYCLVLVLMHYLYLPLFCFLQGDPREPGSLHCVLDEDSLNDYEEVIQVVGDALVLRYSRSKEFIVWGFGAKFDGEVRHIFQCGDEPTVFGVEGILKAYRSVFATDLTMSGPTVYDQVLQAAAMKARTHHVRCMAFSLALGPLVVSFLSVNRSVDSPIANNPLLRAENWSRQ